MKALGIAASVALVAASSAAGALIPTPIGAGPAFRPSASSPAVALAQPVRSMSCATDEVPRVGAHLELFAHGRVVIVPAGIGISPPLDRRDAYVVSGAAPTPCGHASPRA